MCGIEKGSSGSWLAFGERYLQLYRDKQPLWNSVVGDTGVQWDNRLGAFAGWRLYYGQVTWCGRQINAPRTQDVPA